MNAKKTLICFALWLLLALLLSACRAAQDASKSYSRALIERGAIVPAEQVRVHEYLNYYEQRFPPPLHQALALDLRLGNPRLPTSGGQVWLQIGVQAREAQKGERRPLNLALVLDVSGSMAYDGKMRALKTSLSTFLRSLQPDDWVAIVTYSDQAGVLQPPRPVGHGRWIEPIIYGLHPDGATNLHAGLMLGFQMVERNFDPQRNNRVILLTDGIANRGVTDPQRIAQEALAYTERGIYLSTIGLGIDMNDELLSTLARQGRGAYHFIDSYQEMEKVFMEEVSGLVQRAADQVRVTVRPLSGATLLRVTGYEGQPPAEGAQIRLQDMGAGDSQVALVELQVPSSAPGQLPLAEVTLEYVDAATGRPERVQATIAATVTPMASYDPLADIEVRRNVTIVRMAEALKAIDNLFNQAQYLQAWRLARQMEAELRGMAALAGDPQMVEDADLFRRYQQTLASALGYDPALQEAVASPSPVQEQPQRWGPNIPTPLPTLEVE
jgi:Ca-activated chloride channel family protein